MSSSREIEAAQNEIDELLQGEEFNTNIGCCYLLDLLANFLDSLDNCDDPDYLKIIASLPEFNQLEKLYNFLTHPDKEIQFYTAIRIGLAYLSQSEAGRLTIEHYHHAIANPDKNEMFLTDLGQLLNYELNVIFWLLRLSGITAITLKIGDWAKTPRMSLLADLVKDNLITKIKLDGNLSDESIYYDTIYNLFMNNSSLASDLDLIGIDLPAQAEFTGLYVMIENSHSLSSLAISLTGLNDHQLEKLGTSLKRSKVETLTIAHIHHLSSTQFIKLFDCIKKSAISRLEILVSEAHHLNKEIYNLCLNITTKSGEKLVHFIDNEKVNANIPAASQPIAQEPNATAVSSIIMEINYYMKKRANETYSFAILTWLFGYSGKDYYERRASWKEILDQLAKIGPSNDHSLKSIVNTIDDAIKQFGGKGRSQYASKLEKLKNKLLRAPNSVKNKNLENYISTSSKIYNTLDTISRDTKILLENQPTTTNIFQNLTCLEHIQIYSQHQSNYPEFLNVEEVSKTEINNTLRF